MLRVIVFVIPLILAVYALVDLVQTKDEDVRGLPKLVWVLLIVLIGVVGPVAWLVGGRRGRRFPGLAPRSAGPGRRQIAPDDDPDFLRGLNRPKPPVPPRPPAPPAPPSPPEDEDPRPPAS